MSLASWWWRSWRNITPLELQKARFSQRTDNMSANELLQDIITAPTPGDMPSVPAETASGELAIQVESSPKPLVIVTNPRLIHFAAPCIYCVNWALKMYTSSCVAQYTAPCCSWSCWNGCLRTCMPTSRELLVVRKQPTAQIHINIVMWWICARLSTEELLSSALACHESNMFFSMSVAMNQAIWYLKALPLVRSEISVSSPYFKSHKGTKDCQTRMVTGFDGLS